MITRALWVVAAALAATTAAAHPQPLYHGRALAQSGPSQAIKYAPCNAATELTCSGAQSTKPICCNKVSMKPEAALSSAKPSS